MTISLLRRCTPGTTEDQGLGVALVAAVAQRNREMVPILAEAGADPNAVVYICGRPFTPLKTAVARGSSKMVHFLVTLGADVNAKLGRRGQATALAAAALRWNTEVVRILIREGAERAKRYPPSLSANLISKTARA